MEPRRVLGVDGTLAPGYEPALDVEQALDAYRLMLLSRTFDERGISLQRQGRLGTFAPATGQEAAIVGSALALDPAVDWIVPQYREMAALHRHGYSMEHYLSYIMGDLVAARVPDGVRVLPIQISLAAQLPHAVGLAWGLKLQGLDGVVLVYFGDGASSEGDFHEACNLAGVLRAPVVFVLQDNGWAISTPRSQQTAADSFALRAAGYGFPGTRVDGNDLFATYDACRAAVERARRGEGPTLVEATTYRLWAHNTADDHRRYVDAAELERRHGEDPLTRLRVYLRGRGVLDDADEARLADGINKEITEAVELAEARPAPTAADLFANVYRREFPRLERQRAART